MEDEASKLENVFITNHVAKNKKYNTLSEEEDQQFYNYLKSVQEYNQASSKP